MIISLDQADVTPKGNPRLSFLKKIAKLINQNKYVAIENVKPLLKTKPAANAFQRKVMSGLNRLFKGKGTVYNFRLAGTNNWTKELHQDRQWIQYGSLCYGSPRNLKGGQPYVLDLATFAKNIGAQIDGLVKEYIEEDSEDMQWDERYLKIRKTSAILHKVRTNLKMDMTQYPILIFNNKQKSGLFHGATKVRKVDVTKPFSRSINYVGIGETKFAGVYDEAS